VSFIIIFGTLSFPMTLCQFHCGVAHVGIKACTECLLVLHTAVAVLHESDSVSVCDSNKD